MTPAAGGASRLARGLPAVAAPTAIAAFAVVGTIQTQRPPALGALLALVAVLTGAVLVRGDATGWRLAAGLAILAAVVSVACWGEPRNLGWFGMCVIAGWAALAFPAHGAVVAGAGLTAVFVVSLVTVSGEPGWVTWAFGVALTTGAFVFVRRQRELVERLRAARTELADRARTDERHRIAREMHDLVGHGLTVALLHLGSARLALDDDVDAARAALAEAETATRGSLEDVRAAVGLMRGDGPASDPPAPGIAGIGDLVDSYRNAGADIDLDLRGSPTGLTAGRSLTAYRIVQESLTNAVRHGDGGPIRVRLDASAERVRITVRNGGVLRGRGPDGTGIAAMNERATSLGGTLTAGPVAGGWLVEAVIPA